MTGDRLIGIGTKAGSSRRLAGWRLVAAVFAATFLSACSESHRWNQKLTVEVSTPDGVKTGSAVSSVSWGELQSFTRNFPTSYRGEATAVELAPGRYLFALIGDDTGYLAGQVFGDEMPFRKIPSIRKTESVPSKYYPLLVTFADVANPKTIRRVDPARLSASFGPGFSLRRMTLEITDEEATEGRIVSVLGWLLWPREQLQAIGGGTTPLKIPGASIDLPNFRRAS